MGYSVRSYPGATSVSPWLDQNDDGIDFDLLADGLSQLDAFEEEDIAKLADWLREQLG